MARLRGRLQGERSGRHPARPLEDHHLRAGLRLTARRADGPRRPHQPHAFHAYVDQVLVPALKPGDVVVMDNLTATRGLRPRAIERRANCSTFHL